jgi:L-ascorbate metabolism protein UlaG (beta-lactamase superfamily)
MPTLRIQMILLTALFFGLIILAPIGYMRLPKFGKSPEGVRLATHSQSRNFKDGKFQNIESTPDLAEGYSYFDVTYEFLFKDKPRRRPVDIIPSVKKDLLNLRPEQDILVWFGHSSYFIQIDGKRILVDPVFSGNASPIPGTVKSFKGTDIYQVSDLPAIDYLIISHDHYDHVDYETKILLQSKTRKVICGLGVGSHFERWGYTPDQIIEKDWNEKVDLDTGFTLFTKTARHFSGRTLSRNNTLWMSFVLQTPTLKIYLGGDSGYGKHFAEIGREFGPIDLAIIDNGQYDSAWQYVHTLPNEVLQAAKDLNAKKLFPVHSSKFVLANHPWDAPLIEITKLNKALLTPFPLVMPIIGEWVFLKAENQVFPEWWVGLN